MTDHLRFGELIEEFRRVGVDPDTFSAVLAIPPDDALRVLRELPDGAGPEAFLHRLHAERTRHARPGHAPDPSAEVRPPA